MPTKLKLLGLVPDTSLDLAENKEKAKALLQKYEQHLNVINAYHSGHTADNSLTQAIINVSRTEHRRWVAAHELMGYEKRLDGEPTCNEITKQHGCMCDFEELYAFKDRNFPLYDLKTVETTLLLKIEKLKRVANI